MKSLIIGIIILAAAVFTVLPPDGPGWGLGWGQDVLAFLRGGLPVIALLVGFIAVFIGIADMKDSAETKAEAKKEAAAENNEDLIEKG